MTADLDDVQRIVLHGTRKGTPWTAVRHLLVHFGSGAPRHLMHWLHGRIHAACAPEQPQVQWSMGLTRRGLERAGVPAHVMTRFALKSPAFWAGAALRAPTHLGLTGDSAPERWHKAFDLATLDLVISVHGMDLGTVGEQCSDPALAALLAGMTTHCLLPGQALAAPKEGSPASGADPTAQWVHFGYRDGLSRIGIKGWSKDKPEKALKAVSWHQPGEFVLGHPNDTGTDPWVAGPGLRVWPDEVRSFFRNGSFGVLHQMRQHTDDFEKFVEDAARKQFDFPDAPRKKDEPVPRHLLDEVKAKLCGRYPDGRPLASAGDKNDPKADFDYREDPRGERCPFGSHVRRMNPRRLEEPRASPVTATADGLSERPAAHFLRRRPLLRRGLPYGPARWASHGADDTSRGAPPNQDEDGNTPTAEPERGLIGHFFCASIEDQFEHLLGEWADRVPLGSPDRGGARDPLIGLHESGDGPFEVPRPAPAPSPFVTGLRPFVQTVGAAYLFYPSLATVKRIADSDFWREPEEDA